MLVVGDDCNSMYCVVISFLNAIKDVYLSICKFVHQEVLAQFRGPLEAFNRGGRAACQIEKVISTAAFKKRIGRMKVDYHHILTLLGIWRVFNVNFRSQNIRFPLPPCSRFLPMQHSFWNSTKGGSDTSSYLMWLCQASVGNSKMSAQLLPFARTLQLFAIVDYRSFHALTAKASLDYPLLTHYRNAATTRQSFQTCQQRMSAWMIREEADNISKSVSNFTPRQDIPDTPGRRTTRANALTHSQPWSRQVKTGGTPGKGKTKNPRKIDDDVRSFHARLDACCGIPLQRLHKDLKRANQGRCFVCGLYTTFFCGGCRLNFCFTHNRHNELETLEEQGKLGGGVDLMTPVLKMKVMHPNTGVVTSRSVDDPAIISSTASKLVRS